MLALAGLLAVGVAGRSTAEWQSRTIYQVLTDRFGGTNNRCGNLGDYCGGTFRGIIDHLDYITGMGFDAIWISPVVENTNGGYHGYWAKNFYAVNSHFGSKQDLVDLVNACHAKNIWVMVDIVANHVAPIGSDYSQIYPFNSSSHYHQNCQVSHYNCFTDEVYNCRLADLPDLNQGNAFVHDELLRWIKWLMTTFNFDGIRADTVMYITQDFWQDFTTAANTYIVGEVYSDLNCNVQYTKKGVPGTVSYPMYFTLKDVFQNGRSMSAIEEQWKNYQALPNLNAMGTFIDNHDQPRFLNNHGDKVAQYKAAMTYVLMGAGIPIIYYGSELLFAGGNDPGCRETLWQTGYPKDGDTYRYLAKVNSIRKAQAVWSSPQIQRYSANNFYAFTRGNTFVALTNQNNRVQVDITYHPYKDGTTICNQLVNGDCVLVQGGKFTVTLLNGESKIFVPK